VASYQRGLQTNVVCHECGELCSRFLAQGNNRRGEIQLLPHNCEGFLPKEQSGHNGSVTNVVWYEDGFYDEVVHNRPRVCYKFGLLWKWSVITRSVLNGFLMNGVCNEGGLSWTCSVMNRSVANVVCYKYGLLWTWSAMKRGPLWNVVHYERGPLWTWSVMNVVRYERGPLWTWSVMTVVGYERGLLGTWSVMNVVCQKRGLRSVMNEDCNERGR